MPALTDRDAFQARFRRDAEAAFFSPGRVNLIGDHTDYTGGLVFPVFTDPGKPADLARSIELFRRNKPGLDHLQIISCSDCFVVLDDETQATQFFAAFGIDIRNAEHAHGIADTRYLVQQSVGNILARDELFEADVTGSAVRNEFELVLAGEHAARVGVFRKIQRQRRELADAAAAVTAQADFQRHLDAIGGDREPAVIRRLLVREQRGERPADARFEQLVGVEQGRAMDGAAERGQREAGQHTLKAAPNRPRACGSCGR